MIFTRDSYDRRIPKAGRLALRLAFVAAGLAFVVRAVVQGIRDGSFGDLRESWLALSFVAALAAMTTIAARWRSAARLVGGDLPLGEAVPRYFQGELGKYIPGSVWAVLGRGELARRAGLSRTTAYASVVASLVALYLGCALAAALLLPLAAGAKGAAAVLGVLAFLVVGLLGLHPAVIGRVFALAEKVTRRSFGVEVPTWRASISLVLGYLPSWALIAAAHFAAVKALGISAPVPDVAFATAVAWCGGFLAIPAPGGIGVRESIFVLTSGIANPDAAAAALLARVVFVVADGVGAVVSSLWMTRLRGD